MENLKKLPLSELIEREENQFLEIKSSLRYDIATKNSNRELEYEVAKSIAAFMNAEGGILLIGVTDEKRDILGLQDDYKCLAKNKRDRDGFKLHLNDILQKYLGKPQLSLINVVIDKYETKDLCKITVSESPEPIFLEKKNTYEFIVRMGNQSHNLNIKDAIDYIFRHWNYIQDHHSDDFVRNRIEEIFHELESKVMFAIPHDIDMLKQRVELKDFINTLEQNKPSELINLLRENPDIKIQFDPPHHFQRHDRNHTRFDLILPKNCDCRPRNMNIELRIEKEGVIIFFNQYTLHFIAEHVWHDQKNSFRVDLVLKDIKNFLLFLKYTYTHFKVQKFEFILNGKVFENVQVIRGKRAVLIDSNKKIFTKPPNIRMTFSCKSISLESINKILENYLEELARYLNRDVVTKERFLEMMKIAIHWL